MKYAVAALILLAASPAWAQSTCNSNGTQMDLTQCAHDNATQADEELNLIWSEVKPRADASGFGQDLLDAQRTWLSYRDATCDIERARFDGGSIAPMAYHICIERITRARNADLLALL